MSQPLSNLLKTLPNNLTYLGTTYNLIYQIGQFHNTVRIFYLIENQPISEQNVLRVNSTVFYVEAERHYATYFMLHLILNNHNLLLSHLKYPNIQKYEFACRMMYNNMNAIGNIIKQDNIQREKQETIGNNEYINT